MASRKAELTFFEGEVTSSLDGGLVKSRLIPRNESDVYRCEAGNGILLFINNYNFDTQLCRDGATHDKANVISVCRQLGFKILYKENLKKSDFEEIIKILAHDDRLIGIDCLTVFVSSHISEQGILTSDCKVIPINWIVAQFNLPNTEKLNGKPKIFIFPGCRGTKILKNRHIPRDVRFNQPIVDASDTKICYGCEFGYTSISNAEAGSFYLGSLCVIIADRAHDTEFDEILNLT